MPDRRIPLYATNETSFFMIRRVFGVIALAATATAASSSITVPYVITIPNAITRAPNLHINAVGTKDPIRTVITVNSNKIDVLAAEEKDVPKVLEKLRELCAGPYATLYPEICDHLNDPGYWPLTETTIETLPTTVTNAIYHSTTVISSIYLPTTVTASWMTVAKETAPSTFISSTRRSPTVLSSPSVQSSRLPPPPSPASTSAPSPTSRPKTTSLVIPSSPLVEKPYTFSKLSKGERPKGATRAEDIAPVTIKPVTRITRIRTKTTTPTHTVTKVAITVTQSIYGEHISAPVTEPLDCPYSDETSILCSVITIYHHLPIPTIVTVSGPILTFPRSGWQQAGATAIPVPSGGGVVHSDSYPLHDQKEDDDGGGDSPDHGPLPAPLKGPNLFPRPTNGVVPPHIQERIRELEAKYEVGREEPENEQPELDAQPEPQFEPVLRPYRDKQRASEPELEPEFEPEFEIEPEPDPELEYEPDPELEPEPEPKPKPLPTPTHARQFKGLQAYPSISYFRSASPPGGGCTQTVSKFEKVTDFYTSTVYAETVTTTKRFACGDCPNIIILQVGGPGILLEPKTTEVLEGMTGTRTVWGCRETGTVVGYSSGEEEGRE
ncbi:hypothetical protein QBC44DRAFT_368402 [Cladorrhinum sp. PSN332]|nr:hypothetical protein QBC44DRAFT_368402 [Cladorrhinum sp. PSN332]